MSSEDFQEKGYEKIKDYYQKVLDKDSEVLPQNPHLHPNPNNPKFLTLTLTLTLTRIRTLTLR